MEREPRNNSELEDLKAERQRLEDFLEDPIITPEETRQTREKIHALTGQIDQMEEKE